MIFHYWRNKAVRLAPPHPLSDKGFGRSRTASAALPAPRYNRSFSWGTPARIADFKASPHRPRKTRTPRTRMKVTLIPVTPFQQNCSLLIDETTGRAAVCDPGGDLDRILAAVKEQGATLEKIFLTNGHMDHCAGAALLSRELGIPIEGPQHEERFWFEQLPEQTRREIFAVLVEVQDQGMDVAESRKEVAARFGVSEQEIRNVEREGMDKDWPPL